MTTSKPTRVLIAGPWVGEFGWELFAWQGYLRAMAPYYDETVIICRSTSALFYKDFATTFIYHNPIGGPSDQWFKEGYDLQFNIRQILEENQDLVAGRECSLLLPRRIGIPNNGHTHFTETVHLGNHDIQPHYIQFGEESTSEYDYVFHARSRKIRAEDNWSEENWNQLFELLSKKEKRICSIGSTTEAMHISGTTDQRGCSTEALTAILRGSTAVFGPSSGPMHLASLCGTPHVVWSRPQNHKRYTQTWNPLETPVLFLSEHSWHPSALYVYEKFTNWNKRD